MKKKKLTKKSKLNPVELFIAVVIGGALIAVVYFILSGFVFPVVLRLGDSQRKSDLKKMQNAFEAYRKKTGCYPRDDEVCYDSPVNFCGIHKIATSKLCHICGNRTEGLNSKKLGSYTDNLPCDPRSPRDDYLYQVVTEACSKAKTTCGDSICPSDYCPSMYRIYTKLSNPTDEDSKKLGCANSGCGIHPNDGELKDFPAYGYDFGVSSPQIGLEKRR